MKYSIEKNEVVLHPECDMDVYKIGVMHNRYGGRITCGRISGDETRVEEYCIECNIILDFMLLHSDNGKSGS